MSKPSGETILTKDEALQLLSKQLRNPNIEPLLFVKVLTLYSTIAGWNKEKEPTPSEPNLDELVTRIEKERRKSNV